MVKISLTLCTIKTSSTTRSLALPCKVRQVPRTLMLGSTTQTHIAATLYGFLCMKIITTVSGIGATNSQASGSEIRLPILFRIQTL
jgi:hypothetical protein